MLRPACGYNNIGTTMTSAGIATIAQVLALLPLSLSSPFYFAPFLPFNPPHIFIYFRHMAHPSCDLVCKSANDEDLDEPVRRRRRGSRPSPSRRFRWVQAASCPSRSRRHHHRGGTTTTATAAAAAVLLAVLARYARRRLRRHQQQSPQQHHHWQQQQQHWQQQKWRPCGGAHLDGPGRGVAPPPLPPPFRLCPPPPLGRTPRAERRDSGRRFFFLGSGGSGRWRWGRR